MTAGLPPTDFSSLPPSNGPSRNGSFSYSPAISYLAPGAPYGTSPEQHQGPGGPAFPAVVMGQQQQILLGRGLRSAVEYIAPGPPVPSYNQYGYGGVPDMRPIRSPMLEEFRTNRHRSWELVVSLLFLRPSPFWTSADVFVSPLSLFASQDLVNHIVEFSGDQLGSRHIQTKLETASSEEKQLVFEEVLPNMLQLSTDVFANC